MASKGQKKKDSGRASAASKEGAATSAKGIESKSAAKPHYNIWPEWSDADINAEKWETPNKAAGKAEKGKSPSLSFFEDPDGCLELPPSLEVSQWKRIHEHAPDRTPVVVEDPNCTSFDLLTPNEHIHQSEVIRWIISQVTALWRLNGTPNAFVPEISSSSQSEFTSWKPWEHIYSLSKIGKGPNIPQYNYYGKYVVRLFWMGCWRKVLIDDNLPVDDQGRLLLPTTERPHELWPMLLSKALIKVLSLDFVAGNIDCEFGEQSVMHCLTGWIPEPVPMMSNYLEEVWELLKTNVPEFTLPDPNDPKPEEPNAEAEKKDEPPPPKEAAKDKKGGAKDAKKEKVEQPKAEKPQCVAFVTYTNPPKLPKYFQRFRDMSETYERLRKVGLSHAIPHPLMISRTRSCPLEAPPIPPPEPAWKQIRQPKKRSTPLDEPAEPVIQRPEKWIELSSLYLNYKIQPSEIPEEATGRKRSRSSSRSRPATAPLEEVDENEPEKEEPVEEPPAEPPKPEPTPPAAQPAPPQTSSNQSITKAPQAGEKSEAPVSQASLEVPGSKASRGSIAEKKRGSIAPGTGSSANRRKSLHPSKEVPASAEVPPASGDAASGQAEEETPEQPPPPPKEPTELWVHWDDFCKAFKNIVLYHKPSSFAHKETASEFKAGGGFSSSAVGGKKTAASAGGKGNATPSFGGSDERQPMFLSVDSLKKIEILISFSALSKWIEPQPYTAPSSDGSGGLASAVESSNKLREKSFAAVSDVTNIYSDHCESLKDDEVLKKRAQLIPGILVAEPYSWKKLVIGNPIISLKTTGIKSVLLTLKPGRHVLRFHMNAPLAWVANLYSTTKFFFGDEEHVMATVVNESLRFQEHATGLVQKIGRAIKSFDDAEMFQEAMSDLRVAYNPDVNLEDNIDVFRKAFYITVSGLMGDALTSDAVFGLRCLTTDLQTESVLEVVGRKNPDDSSVAEEAPPVSKKEGRKESKAAKLAPGSANDGGSKAAVDTWKDREPNEEEIESIMAIQSAWKGFYSRSIIAAAENGTPEHAKARQQLDKVWSFLEQNQESSGLQLMRTMFRLDPLQMERFPFYKDEWTKIAYQDYNGTFPEQPPATWFLIFRSVFFVEETVLLVPKLSSTINTAFLRVINNDTGEEVPKVFMRVAPENYQKNQKGYTFLCEARTTDTAVGMGKWRMRLIGAQAPLPAPAPPSDSLVTNLYTREIKEYYVPNNNNIIIRYAVRVTEEHLMTVQVQTSKPDVYLELEVLDQEQVVASVRGKGHAVLPAFIFQRDGGPAVGGHQSRNSSPTNAASRSKRSVSGERGRKESTVKKPPTAEGDATALEKEASTLESCTPHKYIIQARVLRNSWPLSAASWAHVMTLKEQEKEEMKANFDKDRPSSEKSGAPPAKPGAAKPSGKNLKPDKAGKDKGGGSRPSSQQFDSDKPHCVLRVVMDADNPGDADVRKDTERIEQIRAIKQAWERGDPGRAERAARRRSTFLEKHLIPAAAQEDEHAAEDATEVPVFETEDSITDAAAAGNPPKTAASKKSNVSGRIEREGTEERVSKTPSNEVLTHEPPPGPPPKMILKPLDLSQYTKKSETKIMVDEDELAKEQRAREEEFQKWRVERAEMKKRREDELQARNQEKIRQIQTYEALQAMTDQARAEIQAKKEAYKQKVLQEERERLAALEAAENATPVPPADKPSSPANKKGKKSPKGSAKGKTSAKGKKK